LSPIDTCARGAVWGGRPQVSVGDSHHVSLAGINALSGHYLAGRYASGPGGPRQQEGHPHRGARQAAAGGGQAGPGGDAGGVAAAPDADLEDVVCLHLRRGAAGGCHRRRGRNAPLPGAGRVQRQSAGAGEDSGSGPAPAEAAPPMDSVPFISSKRPGPARAPLWRYRPRVQP